MLKKRILSAFVLILSLIFIFKVGGLLFLALNLVIVTLALNEYFNLVKGKGIKGDKGLGIIVGLILILLTYLSNEFSFSIYAFLPLSLILILLKEVFFPIDESPILVTATTYFGVLYIAGLLSHGILLYNLNFAGKEVGKVIIWVPLIATWITDTGAYFTGINLGKTSLAPKISPNKTIEGAIGGMLASVIATILLGYYLGFSLLHGAILGGLIAVTAQLGDLCESSFKRDADIKDSGDIIPGHGGILDRIDSLLFTLPIVYYYLHWLILK